MKAILYGSLRRLLLLTIKESKQSCAAAGGIAAKSSSWGIQGAKARNSFATSRDR